MKKIKIFIFSFVLFSLVLTLTSCGEMINNILSGEFLNKDDKTDEPTIQIPNEQPEPTGEVIDVEITGKFNYETGATLESSSWMVNLIYENGTKVKTNNYSIKGIQEINMNVPKDYSLYFTITLDSGKKIEKIIVVKILSKNEYNKASLSFNSGKTQFFIGESINFNDWKVNASYPNGSFKELNISDFEIINAKEISNEIIGIQKVYIKYVENEIESNLEVEIEIIEDKLKGLIFKDGTTSFILGAGIYTNDWKFEAIYESGIKKEISHELINIILPNDVYEIGNKIANVFYNKGENDEIKIEVPFEIVKGKPLKLLFEGNTLFELNQNIDITNWKFYIEYEFEIKEEIEFSDLKCDFDFSKIDTSKKGEYLIDLQYIFKDNTVLEKQIKIKVNAKFVDIEVDTKNETKIYLNEAIDYSNWEIYAVYNDDSKELIDNSLIKYDLSIFDNSKLGLTKITCIYYETPDCNKILAEKEVEIEIILRTYIVEICYDNVTVKENVLDGDILDLSKYIENLNTETRYFERWNLREYIDGSLGTDILFIYDNEITVTNDINLTAKFVKKINLKLQYNAGNDSFDEIIGLKENEEIDIKDFFEEIDNYALSEIFVNDTKIENFSVGESLILSFSEDSIIKFNYESNIPYVIELEFEGTTEFILGEKDFSKNDWKIYGIYSDGNKTLLEDAEYDVSKINPLISGSYNFTITYENIELVQTVKIYERIYKNKYLTYKTYDKVTVTENYNEDGFYATKTILSVNDFKTNYSSLDRNEKYISPEINNITFKHSYSVVPNFIFLKTYNAIDITGVNYEKIGGFKYWAIPVAALSYSNYDSIKKTAAMTITSPYHTYAIYDGCLDNGVKAISLTEWEYTNKSVSYSKMISSSYVKEILSCDYDKDGLNPRYTHVVEKSISKMDVTSLNISNELNAIKNLYTTSSGSTLTIYVGNVIATISDTSLDGGFNSLNSANEYCFEQQGLWQTATLIPNASVNQMIRPSSLFGNDAYSYKFNYYSRTYECTEVLISENEIIEKDVPENNIIDKQNNEIWILIETKNDLQLN